MPFQAVHPAPLVAGELADGQQVEEGPQVGVEGVVALPGEDLPPAGDGAHGGRREGGVVRGGLGADVGRGHGRVRDQVTAPSAVHPGQGVELAHVPVRVVQALDGPGVVEEGVAVAHLGAEAELEGDVLGVVAVVVHPHGVHHVRVEAVEVGPGVGHLEGDVVGDEGHRPVVLRAGKHVEVGPVGPRVLGDQGGLAVAGGGRHRGHRGGGQGHRGQGQGQRRCQAGEQLLRWFRSS